MGSFDAGTFRFDDETEDAKEAAAGGKFDAGTFRFDDEADGEEEKSPAPSERGEAVDNGTPDAPSTRKLDGMAFSRPRPQGDSPIPLTSAAEAKSKGEIGVAELARTDYEAATGAEAPGNPVMAQISNMGLSVGGRLSSNLQTKAAQRLASGEEMSDGEVDSQFDLMLYGATAPLAATGRAIRHGFRARPDSVLREWDEGEGKRIEDPQERSRARRAFAGRVAADLLKGRAAVKQNAQTELENREVTHTANIVTHGLAQVGYSAPYFLGPGGIAAQFLEEGSANALEYSNDEYGYDDSGRFRLVAKGDDAGRAALAGFGTAGIETATEVALGRLGGAVLKRGVKAAGRGIGQVASKIPGVKDAGAKAAEIGAKFAATGVGRLTGKFVNGVRRTAAWTNRKFHIGGIGEENLEEWESATLNAITGWDRRESELADPETGSPTTALERVVRANREFFTPKNLIEMNEAFLITMGGGAFVANCAMRGANRNVDNLIRRHDLMTEEELAEASPETKAAALDAWAKGLTSEQTEQTLRNAGTRLDRLVEWLEGGADGRIAEIDALREKMEERHARNVGKELDALNVPRQRFDIPMRKDKRGRNVPDFRKVEMQNTGTGKVATRNAVYDESGIAIVDNEEDGDAAYTVVMADGRSSRDFPTLTQAVNFATAEKNRAALEQARDELKMKYVAEVVDSEFKGAKVVCVKTMDEALEESRRRGEDVSAAPGFNRGRSAWRLKDGTAVLVRDNLKSPAEIKRVLRHETAGHSDAAMSDGFMGRALRGQSDVKRNYVYGRMQGADAERALREAVANAIQRRRHAPDAVDRLVHWTRDALRKMGVDLKMSDADFEVEVARIERELRDGRGGSFENRPRTENAGAQTSQGAEQGAEQGAQAQRETETPQGAQAGHGQENADETGNQPDEAQPQPRPGQGEGRQAEGEAQGQGAEAQANGAGQGVGAESPAQTAQTAQTTPRKPVSERTVVEKMTDEAPVEELDVAEVFNDDTRIPNFKEGANPETGEVDPLHGEPYDLVSNPIVVMEFRDGKKVVVTGRHRLALYRRAERKKIAARVIREADGWTVKDAQTIDAIGNIIDEKGTVKDYVKFFDDVKPGREQAEAGGFLSRPKGRLAFGIFEGATADTRAAIDFDGSGAEGLISPEQAGIIAEAAPKDAHPRFGAVQKILVRKAAAGLRGAKLRILARALAEEAKTRRAAPKSGEMQLDLFTSEEDLELLAQEERRADYRAKKANEFKRVAEVLRTAMRKGGKLDLNAKYARELGITDPNDRAQLKAARDRAARRAEYWENAVRLEDADRAAMDAELGIGAAADGGNAGGSVQNAQSAPNPPTEIKGLDKPVEVYVLDGQEVFKGVFANESAKDMVRGSRGGKMRVTWNGKTQLVSQSRIFPTEEKAKEQLANLKRQADTINEVAQKPGETGPAPSAPAEGGGFSLESASAEQLKEEKRKREEKAKIKAMQERPLKGGSAEEGQSLLDLGGAEGEDLFNRTQRQETQKPEAPKAQRPAEQQNSETAKPSEVEDFHPLPLRSDGISLTFDEWKRRTGGSGLDYSLNYHINAPGGTDKQGNPLERGGKLKVESVADVGEITDRDFVAPTRNVRLPELPKNVDAAIGAEGKPVIIKRSIFERNYTRHGDLTPAQSREILRTALYSPDLYGQNQKTARPYNWVLINVPDGKGKNRLVLVEVSRNKDNVEIVHWHHVRDAALETLKKQAEREGGQILMLPSKKSEEDGGLSVRPNGLTEGNVPKSADGVKPARPKEYAEWLAKYRLEDTPERFAEWQGKQNAKTKKTVVLKDAKADNPTQKRVDAISSALGIPIKVIGEDGEVVADSTAAAEAALSGGTAAPRTPSIRMKNAEEEAKAQKLEDELAALFDSPELDADSTIVSGDEVRKTMPGYDRLDWATHVDRTGFVGPRLEAQFQRLLKERKGKGDGHVVFLAGGNGAGKSTVAARIGDTHDFTIDSTLGNADVARKQIDAILANGQTPEIHFVYRSPWDALNGIANRVKNGGHIVSPLSFANSHVKSRENLRLLSDEYGDRIRIHIYDNSVDGAPEMTLEQLEAKKGPTHEAIRKYANTYLENLRNREKESGSREGSAAGGGTQGEARARQTALSGETSLNQNPAGNRVAHMRGVFKRGTRNVDIGAGKYGRATEFLNGIGVENIPFDPVNRDEETNRRSAESVRANPADTATVHNVLNVIDSDEVMEGIVNQAARAIKKDGTAVFTIYEGDRTGRGRATSKGYQRNAKTSAYVPAMRKYFGEVETHGNVVFARRPKDVGPAFWAFDSKFADGIDFDSPEFDPEMFQKRVGAVAKLVKTYRDSGAADFRTLATRMAERFPEKFSAMKPYLRGVWNAVAEQMGLDEVSRKDADAVYSDVGKRYNAPIGTTRKEDGNVQGMGQPRQPDAGGTSAHDRVHARTGDGKGEGGDARTRPPADGAERAAEPVRRGGDGRGQVLPVERHEVGDGAVPAGARERAEEPEAGEAVGEDARRPVRGGGKGPEGGGPRAQLESGKQDGLEGGAGVLGEEPAGGSAGSVAGQVRAALERETPNAAGSANYAITDADERAIEGGSALDKARRNVEAIRIVRRLAEEGRPATEEEKSKLARYVGWGGLKDMFNRTYYYAYERDRAAGTVTTQSLGYVRHTPLGEEGYDLYRQMRELLTEEEMRSAEQSTLNAFFTPIRLCRAIHKALAAAGLKGGRLLETSAGVGNLIGTGRYADARWTAVEIDGMSGQILKALYPDADVRISGFEDVAIPNNFMDAAVSNVPFGTTHPFDPDYKGRGFVIHDFFFAKAVDKLRPGGVAALVTDPGTLDKRDKRLVRYLSEHGGKIVGAVRLPNGFFAKNAGTDVATDVVFIQKVEGKADNSAFMRTEERGDCPVSGYFIDNPGLCLGEMTPDRGPYGPKMSYRARGGISDAELDAAVARAAAGLEHRPANEAGTPRRAVVDADANGLRNGNVGVVDGKVVRRENGELLELPKDEVPKLSVALLRKGVTPAEVVKAVAKLRDAFRAVVDGQLADCSDAELKRLQGELEREYAAFTSRYGQLHGPVAKNFVDLDYADAPLMLGMEKEEKVPDGTDARGMPKTKSVFSRADVFTKRTIFTKPRATKAASAMDGLRISLNETGKVDTARIAELTGRDEADVRRELLESGRVFANPETDRLETRDEYLSGAVRRKLKAARAAVAIDASFGRNVEALEKVQPDDIAATDVSYQLGQSWIPVDLYEKFFREVVYQGTSPRLTVSYDALRRLWVVDSRRRGVTEYDDESGLAMEDLLQRTMNGQSIVVRRSAPDGGTFVDADATTSTKIVQEKIARSFQSWMTDDADRADRIERIYNDAMNDSAPRDYDVDLLEFRGLSEEWTRRLGTKGREYQRRCVARGTFGGNLLIAHCVGAGKTFEMASVCMQLRRLGIARKPLFVVPNHMLAQWDREFHEAYPGANVLVATKKDLQRENRRKFLAKVTNGNWDAVVMAHSSFSRIAMSPRHQAEYVESEVATLEDLLHGTNDKREQTRIKKQIQSMRDRMRSLLDPSRKDDSVKFEELGCDYLFVDEAHNFKGIDIHTHMSNVPGVAGAASQRAMDLEMKCRYMAKLHGGDRGVVFATGTPISNSVSEMYVMMRYLAPTKMEQMGVRNFDDWARQFGRVVTGWSPNPSGVGFREKARFSQFQNVPEMKRFFRSFADVVLDSELDIRRPKMAGGKPVQHVIPPSEAQKAYVEDLNRRMERMQSTKVDPRVDNMLKVTTEGRLLAIDPMLVGVKDESHTRANVCADEVKRIYDESTGKWARDMDGNPVRINGTQLVFCDSGVPKKKGAQTSARVAEDERDASAEANGDAEVDGMLRGRFDMYEELRRQLVRRGIPAKEIAFIHDAETIPQKQALFDRVKKGEIRVLIGNTAKMGEGTNVQDMLVAIHHLDIPWKPAWMTQRNGRGIRAGNMNDEVSIHHYITEGTFDVYSWDTVLRKAKFIEVAMNGSMDERTVEDVDTSVMSLEEGRAVAAGNPRLLERVKLAKAVERAQMEFDAQAKAADRAARRVRVAERELAEVEKAASERRGAIERYGRAKGDSPFTLTTVGEGPKDLTDSKETAEYVQGRLAEFAAKGSEVGLVGRLFGFDVRFERGSTPGIGVRELGIWQPVQVYYGIAASFTPGELSQFKAAVTRATGEKALEAVDRKIADARKQLDVARKAAANAAGFDRASAGRELGEKVVALARLNAALGINDGRVLDRAEAFLREQGLPGLGAEAANPAENAADFDSPELDAAEDAEYRAVRERWHSADGTPKPGWMKAPNGRPTKLTERQWVQVRTPAFKKWFGDWERKATADAILGDEDIVVGKSILAMPPKEQRIVAKDIYDKLKNGKPVVTRDGRSVRFTSVGFREIKSHSADPHTLAIVPILRDVISTAHYFGEGDPIVENGRKMKYHLYARRVNLGDGSMVARIVLREDVNGNIFYDEESTSLENIREIRNSVTREPNTGGKSESPHAPHSIAEFFAGINPTSKVVDENGEPKVVYHGSRWNPLEEPKGEAEFSIAMTGTNGSPRYGKGVYFTDDEFSAEFYRDNALVDENGEEIEEGAKGAVTACFLNMRKPGEDGRIEEGDTEDERFYVVFSPEQIKSATDNTGAFDANSPDIRFDSPELDLRGGGGNGTIGGMDERAVRTTVDAMTSGTIRHPRFTRQEVKASNGHEHDRLWSVILSLEPAGSYERAGVSLSQVAGRPHTQGREWLGRLRELATRYGSDPRSVIEKDADFLDAGAESRVYRGQHGKVVKVRRLNAVNAEGVVDTLARLVYHNRLFPKDAYTLADIAVWDNGGYDEFYLILEQPFVTPKTDAYGFIVPPTDDQIAAALGRTSQRFTFVRGYGAEDSETAQGSSGMVEAARVVAAGPEYAVYDFKPGANTFIDAETGEVRFIDPRVDLNDPAAGFPYSRYGERNSRGTVRKASAASYDEYDDYDGYGDENEDGVDFDSPELDADADAPRSVADVCARISDEVAAAVEAEERDGWRSAGISAAPRGRGTGTLPQGDPVSLGAGTRGRAVTPQTFLREARKLFPDVAFRPKGTKRMAKWKAGQFEAVFRLIRLRDVNSVGTVCHEVGHEIEHLTRYEVLRLPAVKRDLSDLGHALYGPDGPMPPSYIGEGFAEYVRGYVCDAPNLHSAAPDLDDWFRGEFAKRRPDVVKRLDRLRGMAQTMKEQSAAQLVDEFMRPSSTAVERAWAKAKEFLSAENWNDSNSVILRGMRKSGMDELFRWQDEFRELERCKDPARRAALARSITDKIESNPYLFATTVRGTSAQRVMDMARHGTTNLLGNRKTGESMKEIFADFTPQELADWKRYAIARHGIANYFDKGLEFGIQREVLEAVVAQFGSPKFEDALKRFTDYSHRILRLGVDAGLISLKTYEEIVKNHPIYVRITRRHDADGASAGRGGSAINRRTGGFDHVFDPIDAALMDQEKYLRACFQAKTVQLIAAAGIRAALANRDSIVRNGGPNTTNVSPLDEAHHAVAAYWPVRVPNAQEKVTFAAAKLKGGLGAAADAYAALAGTGEEENKAIMNFVQALTDPERGASLTVFRDRPSYGRDGRLVSVYLEDRLQTYELPDAKWADMLLGLDDSGDMGFFEKIGARATSLLRLGATTLNPAFAVRNAIRDTLHSAVVSETGALPGLNTLNGMLKELTGRESAAMFRSMGGHMSDLVGLDKEQKWNHGGKVALARNAGETLRAYSPADWLLMKPLVKACADVLALPEIGPRINEMAAVLKKCRDAGLGEDAAAILAMGHAKDVSIDFQRAGKAMRRLNRFIPFLNAGWRGMEQGARNLGLLRALPHQFEDRRIRKLAKTAALGTATLTVANVLVALLEMSGDDDERRAVFERPASEKWEYMRIGDWRIPLPFEYGILFGALPRAVVYEMHGDRGAVAECLATFAKSLPLKYFDPDTAANSVAAVSPALDVMRNKDWRGRPIVQQHVMDNYEKQDWQGPYTTEAARRLGAALGQSPAQLEHILDGYTGGGWRRAAVMAENFGDFSRLAEGRGISFVDTLRARPNATRLLEDFYRQGREWTRAANSGTIGLEDYGRLAAHGETSRALSEVTKKVFAVFKDKSLNLAGRDRRIEALQARKNEIVRAFNDARGDWRRIGIARAAAALTNGELDEDARRKWLGVLKGVPRAEAEAALVRFGSETVTAKVAGVERPRRRWSQDALVRRVKRLRTVWPE